MIEIWRFESSGKLRGRVLLHRRLRRALVAGSFPKTIESDPSTATQDPSSRVVDEPHESGGSPAFRRHIPLSASLNDHPTNWPVLHQIHHWAMDRNIVALAPGLHWHVSKLLDPRRSNG